MGAKGTAALERWYQFSAQVPPGPPRARLSVAQQQHKNTGIDKTAYNSLYSQAIKNRLFKIPGL